MLVYEFEQIPALRKEVRNKMFVKSRLKEQRNNWHETCGENSHKRNLTTSRLAMTDRK